MQINLFLIPFVIVLGLLLAQNDNKKSRMIYIVLCSAVLAFIAAMRSPVWMTNTYQIDTLNYLYIFESASDMSWDDLFHLPIHDMLENRMMQMSASCFLPS